MASFCVQCSEELGFPTGDFKRDDPLPVHLGWPEICEGCGPTLVTSEGRCMGGCLTPGHEREAP